MLELHESQVSYATELFTENGLTPRVMSSAEADATVIVGVRSEPDATGG
ncbi:hypothetical protein [Spiractinospora alimapuensis]|nr:hypothetical protein [Spiractinospora alimapuensis]